MSERVAAPITAAKRAVFVVGMHRSGTSALVRALSFFGFALPTDLMPPQPDNPKGFWESQGIVRLNEKILRSLGGSWDGPGPWYASGRSLRDTELDVHAHVQKSWRGRASAVLEQAYGKNDSIILKDPRICLLLPLWRQAVEAAGYRVQLAMTARNPLDVAASLRLRNGMAPRSSVLLWQHYVLACLDPDTGAIPEAVVHFDDLISRPKDTMQRLLAAMGIEAADELSYANLVEFIDDAGRHRAAGNSAVQSSMLLAPLTKRTWQLLCGWNEMQPAERSAEANALWNAYRDAMLLAGPLKPFRAKANASTERPRTRSALAGAPADSARTGSTRILLMHYHLFKNAGTSVDELLRQNFGPRWEQKEFAAKANDTNAAEVEEYLRGRPELGAFSSHTANLPAPALAGRRVFPLFFLRHPIDRIRSAYAFERIQDADTFGAALAKQQDFVGYVRALLERPAHRQARNFQTCRLAFGQPDGFGSELERAKATVAALPFVGLVEAFEASLARLQQLLAPLLPDFEAVISRKNATLPGTEPLEPRLERIAQELGPALNAALWDANADDLALFELVRRQYGG